MTRPEQARQPRSIARGVIALALIGMGAACYDLYVEWGVHRAEQTADAQGLALARQDLALVRDITLPPGSDAPRAQAFRALILARKADVETDPRSRAVLFENARRAIARALAGRPDWAEADVIAAYIAARETPGALSSETLSHLTRSYRAARFLRDSGAWRVATGFAAWSRLPDDVRGDVVDEAVWLARLSASMRPAIFDLARQSPGYMLFSRRWTEMRAGDADVRMASQRAAP